MTLVFVAKDMTVANPVGMVNINPLPNLPSGISRAHLTRRSLNALNINLVDGTTGGFTEYHRDSIHGDLVYDDVSIRTNRLSSGWYDENWSIPYKEGVTWMFVFYSVVESEQLLMASGDYVTPTEYSGGKLNLQISHDPLRARFGGTNMAYVGVVVESQPTAPFMVFGTSRNVSAGERTVFVPHLGAFAETDFSDTDGVETIDGLLLLSLTTDSSLLPDDARMYFIAQWDRVLSQSEMAAAYNALRPWLASRGVVIA